MFLRLRSTRSSTRSCVCRAGLAGLYQVLHDAFGTGPRQLREGHPGFEVALQQLVLGHAQG